MIHGEFKKQHGMELRAGTEPEMMWLTRDEKGKALNQLCLVICIRFLNIIKETNGKLLCTL